MKQHLFFVSRQLPYYQEGHNQVEVAQGGIDYSGADMLVSKYAKLGEGDEFVGMRKAVDAAIAIARQWSIDSKEEIFIATGCTHGMFTELEGEPFTEDLAKQLQSNADEFDENLPKCGHCGDIIEGNSWFLTDDPDGARFCREFCAEEAEREWQLQLAADNAGEEDEDDE